MSEMMTGKQALLEMLKAEGVKLIVTPGDRCMSGSPPMHWRDLPK